MSDSKRPFDKQEFDKLWKPAMTFEGWQYFSDGVQFPSAADWCPSSTISLKAGGDLVALTVHEGSAIAQCVIKHPDMKSLRDLHAMIGDFFALYDAQENE